MRSSATGGYSYVVQTALYPGDVDVSQPCRLIQAALDDQAKVLEPRKRSKVEWRKTVGGLACLPPASRDRSVVKMLATTSW